MTSFAKNPSAWLIFFLLPLVTIFGAPQAAEKERAFDHDETAFPLDAAHAIVRCDACHLKGVFRGTPNQCADCHTIGGEIRAGAASPQHIRSTRDCDYCHRTASWADVFKVDHIAVIGSCQSCHNGVIATGKHSAHLQSSEICDDCHRTFSWANVVYDHRGISSNCINCHNGITATGRHASHIPSTVSCEECHAVVSWTPVIRVDHNAVVGSCFSCHNGTIAEGKPPDHPEPSSNDCAVCHSTRGWLPAL